MCDASPAQLRSFGETVKKAVESAANTRFDSAHFNDFGESSPLHYRTASVIAVLNSIHCRIHNPEAAVALVHAGARTA